MRRRSASAAYPSLRRRRTADTTQRTSRPLPTNPRATVMAEMRRVDVRPFIGWTLLLALGYGPIVAYVLWLHFYSYVGPRWVLLIPVLAAICSGCIDHKLSAFRCAVLLTGSGYLIAVVEGIREAIAGASPWYEVPMNALFAAIWFSTAIFVATMALVMFGRGIWLFFLETLKIGSGTERHFPGTSEAAAGVRRQADQA